MSSKIIIIYCEIKIIDSLKPEYLTVSEDVFDVKTAFEFFQFLVQTNWIATKINLILVGKFNENGEKFYSDFFCKILPFLDVKSSDVRVTFNCMDTDLLFLFEKNFSYSAKTRYKIACVMDHGQHCCLEKAIWTTKCTHEKGLYNCFLFFSRIWLGINNI